MYRVTLVLSLALLSALFAACGGDDGEGGGGAINPFGLQVDTITAASHPTALTFAPDGRLFFAEKYTGDIRIVGADGTLRPEPFAHIDVANWLDKDWGLTGLALDPGFSDNGYVYAFYTEISQPSDQQPIARPVLVRFTEEDGVGVDRTVLIDDFPETQVNHQGYKTNGAIRFGPDGALYLTIGDYDWGKNGPNDVGAAQDLSFPGGKVFRVDSEGQALPDHPFAADPEADARIYAYGFAHGAPFAFDPASGEMYTTDSTDSCEELDLVRPGANYGWPDVGDFPFSDCYAGTQERAIYLIAGEGKQPGQFLSATGISGMTFVSAAGYPMLGDGLLTCSQVEGLMRRLVLAGGQVTANDVVVDGCTRDVATAPDGTIYYSNDTEIRRLRVPTSPAASP
jgi:glucose/arabinose dehydrogenase